MMQLWSDRKLRFWLNNKELPYRSHREVLNFFQGSVHIWMIYVGAFIFTFKWLLYLLKMKHFTLYHLMWLNYLRLMSFVRILGYPASNKRQNLCGEWWSSFSDTQWTPLLFFCSDGGKVEHLYHHPKIYFSPPILQWAWFVWYYYLSQQCQLAPPAESSPLMC